METYQGEILSHPYVTTGYGLYSIEITPPFMQTKKSTLIEINGYAPLANIKITPFSTPGYFVSVLLEAASPLVALENEIIIKNLKSVTARVIYADGTASIVRPIIIFDFNRDHLQGKITYEQRLANSHPLLTSIDEIGEAQDLISQLNRRRE